MTTVTLFSNANVESPVDPSVNGEGCDTEAEIIERISETDW